MKKFATICMVLTAVTGFAIQNVEAAPASTSLALTTDSSLTIFVSTLSGATTGSATSFLTGTIDATIDDASPISSTAEITDAEIDLSDDSLFLDLSLFGGVEAALIGVGINSMTSNGGMTLNNTSGVNPFTYTFDPGENNLDATINEGLLTYNGTGALGGILGMGTFDFAADNLDFSLGPVGQIGLLTQNQNGATVDVTVSVPVSFSDQIATDPVTIDVFITGAFVATGQYIIPEPSTLVLLGLAGLGLVPVWRRLRK